MKLDEAVQLLLVVGVGFVRANAAYAGDQACPGQA